MITGKTNGPKEAGDACNHSILAWSVQLILLLLVEACVMTGLPTAEEVGDVLSGQKTLMLLRVTVDIDGKASEPFAAILPDDNVGLAFVGGDSVRPLSYRYLSDEARRDGWIYIIADPGSYYMAVQPPRRENAFSYIFKFRSAPRWRIDALAGSRLVYVGRLRVIGVTQPGLLFSSYTVYDVDKTTVEDERTLARDLAAKFFPDLGSPVTVLMEPLGLPAAAR